MSSNGERPEQLPLSNFQISLLIGGGVVAASQIGKAAITISAIRTEMSLSYSLAGLIVAIFATLGALFGIGAGAFVSRIGVRTAMILGMFLISLGSFLGALAADGNTLLIARFAEGVGFFGVVLSVPTALAQGAQGAKRDFVMAIWSAYMPFGIMIFLALGPLIPIIGWRELWLIDALVALIYAIAMIAKAPNAAPTTPVHVIRFFSGVRLVAQDTRCLALAGAFFAYSCQIFSLAFALPLLLTATYGKSVGTAGLLSAAVLLISTAGHLSSGFLLRKGIPIWQLLFGAFLVFSFSSVAVYDLSLSAVAVALVAAMTLGFGGVAPGALYAAAPQAARDAASVPTTIGLLQQASNLGQFAGPFSLGLCAEHFGWISAPLVMTPIAIVGLFLSLLIRRVLENHTGAKDVSRGGAVIVAAEATSPV